MLLEYLLSQLKFARHIENGATIFDYVFELMSVATDSVRLIIINQLGDIIHILRHDEVAIKLMYVSIKFYLTHKHFNYYL